MIKFTQKKAFVLCVLNTHTSVCFPYTLKFILNDIDKTIYIVNCVHCLIEARVNEIEKRLNNLHGAQER